MADGYFPEGSMLRFVQSHRAVGHTYGQRALIIGATHPVPYVGTSDSTHAKERPFGRLASTAKVFETVFFGSTAEADRVLAQVAAMHRKVRGRLERDEGSFAAGTPYDAYDPTLMFWTMAMLADSSRVAFETLVRPLSRGEREDLWADWVRFGQLFGMPRSAAPATGLDFEEWMAAWFRSDRMHLTDEARVVGRAIARDMPVPITLRVGIRATNLVVQGMLPASVRRLYGLRWTPAHERAFRAAAAGVRRSQAVVPDRLRLGDNRGLHDLVIATERRRVAAGRPTMHLPVAG
ncbi:oxygenase MpaB family protein [Nocardioides terrisoli]|uniref:oxygenase MpaB family protein n=1 Tax=Nocardioides terrisoli TaxID=3388267 RepID=UPI00287B6F2F|nr:oxygenase MpaB family protein [Nocardioides marmorisolisilvae]